MLLENPDCLSLILSKISYVDNINFRLTCKYAKNIQSPNFKDIFIERLLEHHIVPSYETAVKFCNNLYETGAYVAGSFILDCLYNTNYHQDIDIYDQTILKDNYIVDGFEKFGDDNLKFTQSLYELEFLRVSCSCGPDPVMRSYLHKSYPNLDNKLCENIYDTYTVKFVDKTKDTIQIIPIALTLKENERSFIPRFIKASFDLEICQSLFDGKNLYIKNLDKIINKYDFIKPNTRFMDSVYPRDDERENIMTNIRMEKYIKRGFDIKFHPHYDEIDNFIKDELKLNKYNVINTINEGRHQNNIKYIDNGEIDLSKYDY
jgi:hypothetical protein